MLLHIEIKNCKILILFCMYSYKRVRERNVLKKLQKIKYFGAKIKEVNENIIFLLND